MKVNPGKGCPTSYTVDEIAQANVDVLRRCMPVAIRSANFLSGGQSLEDAAARLCAMNKVKGNFPVNLSFSWSAALQVRDLIPSHNLLIHLTPPFFTALTLVLPFTLPVNTHS